MVDDEEAKEKENSGRTVVWRGKTMIFLGR